MWYSPKLSSVSTKGQSESEGLAMNVDDLGAASLVRFCRSHVSGRVPTESSRCALAQSFLHVHLPGERTGLRHLHFRAVHPSCPTKNSTLECGSPSGRYLPLLHLQFWYLSFPWLNMCIGERSPFFKKLPTDFQGPFTCTILLSEGPNVACGWPDLMVPSWSPLWIPFLIASFGTRSSIFECTLGISWCS